MAVPYTFGSATTSIPLSQLDSNFATTITLGNTAIQLGNTVTTLNNMTLANVTITSGTSSFSSIANGTSNVTVNSSGGNITLGTAGTTAITVDASQKVGIGTASPTEKLSVAGAIATTGQLIPLSGSTALGYIGNDNSISGGSGSNIGLRAESAMLFATSGATERMRIDSSGNLLVGTTTAGSWGANCWGFQIGSGFVVQGHANGTASGTQYIYFDYNNGPIGSITQNGTTGVLYNLTSDYRLKNNPVALTGAKDFVMALQPKTWDWWDNSGKGVGFIAHEFMEVAKYSGHGEKDEVDADGKPVYQSIQPSSSEVMANIVALMQEQQATITAQAETINALTARIVALESK